MKYSLLVPTRNRENMVANYLDSVYKMTHKKNDIEVLFVCDEDDDASQNYVKRFQKQYERTIDIKLFTRGRTEFINEDYYNFLAHKASGDYLWIQADDLEMTQPGWDTRVSEAVEHYAKDKPDKIFCISIKDNTPVPRHTMPKFPCFPMFPKQVLEFLGYLLYPTVPTWGTDYIAYVTFQPINRLLEIHDANYINHISHHTKQVEVDATAKRVGAIFNRLKGVPAHNTDLIMQEIIPGVRNKILNKIQDFNQIGEK